MLKKYDYILKNLDCANCANKIQNKIAENKNYKDVVVNFNTLKLSLYSNQNENNTEKDIKEIIEKLEPEVEVIKLNDSNNKSSKNIEKNNNKTNLIRIISGILVILISFIVKNVLIKQALMIFSYIILLSKTAYNALKLLKKKTINESFLITISCIGAYLIGEKFEGLMVIILYEIGKILEEKAVNNTRKSITSLMNIKPEYANLKHESHEHKVGPEEVNIGDIILIKVGEKIPLDGIIIKGEAKLNTSSLTGESRLINVKENDKVLSGSINEEGIIEVKVTEKYENSTVSKILELVENATDKKAKTETFVNKASRIYTPIVIILAILVAIFLPAILNITYVESIYRALIFLVISCPCAIAISVPLSYFSGIGKASKNGILIKGSNFLDALKDIKYIAFDKTATLTKGKFVVEEIKVYDKKYSEDDILEYAAIGESFSNHPLATCVLDKYGKQINKEEVSEFEEIKGKGLKYKLENKIIKVGNSEFTDGKEEKYGTIIYVNIENKVIGSLILNDEVKEEAKDVIKTLKKLRITTMMFTGDNFKVAQKVAKEIGINKVKAKMLPDEKYNEIESIIKNKSKGNVAFVGDGINDAPVLALSDIGIAMGGVGASAAIEASDIVIMTDNLKKIEEAIKISKITNKVIKQNLVFALGIKIIVLLLSVIGLSQMWMAIFADVGVTLITILNTIRILK